MRRRGKTALAALATGAALSLSACTGLPETAPQPAAPPTAAAPAAAKLAAIAPAAAPAPELIGLTRAEVARLLGAPTLLRREPPAEVWQYAGAACVLHVFIYQEVGVSRVAYYDSGSGGARSMAARDCYDRLRSEANRRAATSDRY